MHLLSSIDNHLQFSVTRDEEYILQSLLCTWLIQALSSTLHYAALLSSRRRADFDSASSGADAVRLPNWRIQLSHQRCLHWHRRWRMLPSG